MATKVFLILVRAYTIFFKRMNIKCNFRLNSVISFPKIARCYFIISNSLFGWILFPAVITNLTTSFDFKQSLNQFRFCFIYHTIPTLKPNQYHPAWHPLPSPRHTTSNTYHLHYQHLYPLWQYSSGYICSISHVTHNIVIQFSKVQH